MSIIKYKQLTIFLLLLPLFIYTQNSKERKGRFLFSIGPEYRVTPIYNFKSDDVEDITTYTNVDYQNSGMGLNISVEYFVFKNLSLGFTNSVRYDMVNSESTEISNPVYGVKKADYKLLMGYHFYLTYYFKLLKKSEFFVNMGYSLLNRNSEFSHKFPVYDQDGNYFTSFYEITNYSYSSFKYGLGYKRGKGKIALGIYHTTNTPYFKTTTPFIVPFINASYSFGKW